MGFLDSKQHDYKLRAGDNIAPPILYATVTGTSGSTSLSYVATFGTLVGESLPTEVVTVTDAAATLTQSNYVELSVDSVPAGVTSVRYYKLDGGQYKLLGSPVTSSPWTLNDNGVNTLSGSVIAPTTDTSGRPEWRAMLWHAGRYLQRQELMDLQWLLQRSDKDLGDTIHKNGDIIEGLAEQFDSGTTWNFTAGKIYLDGQHVPVAAGSVTLTGSGKEVVGLTITPTVVTSGTDAYIKNQDEGVDLQYAQVGADRLVYTITWVVDTAGQVDIREFLDNSPVFKVTTTERSELQKEMARRTYDTSGNYTVRPFPIKMRENVDEDDDLMTAYIYAGKAYVEGNEIETIAHQEVEVPKARVVASINNSVLGSFDATGGYTIGTTSENFNVAGLAVKLKVGSGNSHTVTFDGGLTAATAAQVADAINTSVNAYPTNGVLQPIVQCAASATHVMIKAADGKNLTIEAVASDAYTVLGISTGTYYVSGTRIYEMDDNYVKEITDLSYITKRVEAVTRDGGSDTDDLEYAASTLVGVSNTLADCHDGKFDYIYLTDFKRTDGDIDWSLGGSDPTNGATYYLKYRHSYNPTQRTKVRVTVTDAKITKGSEDGLDVITFLDATSAVESVSGNAVVGLTGNASDVIRILKVNNTPGQSADQYSLYSLTKNNSSVDSIEIGTSSIDWSAAGSQGGGSTGQPVTGAVYYITFEYWKTTAGDYVSPDSYINDYAEIELAPDGVTALRDCIDFRRLGATGDSSMVLPVPEDSPRLDYDYYLARVDKIALGSDGYFFRIPGSPAVDPPIPQNQTGPLSMFQLTVPPYTYSPDNVIIEKLDVQRKTQWSLNEMQLQIDRLKYQAALTEVQKDATDNPAAAEAKGIFTDSLVGFKHSDVSFDKNSITFDVAIDTTEQCLRLPAAEDGQTLSVDLNNSTNIAKVGSVVVFDYSPSAYISQLKATSILNVNPNEVYGWTGTMGVSPLQDFWTDVAQLASIDVNYDEQMNWVNATNAALARQITWGAWKIAWDNSGGWAARTMYENNNNLTGTGGVHWTTNNTGANAAIERTGTYKQLVPERTLVEVADRVVDLSTIPYCRTTISGNPFYINISVEGVLPSTDMACTIDGVPVDLLAVAPSSAGVSTYRSKSTVASSGAGKLTARFVMPSGIPVGKKTIHVFSASDPEETYAMGSFTSQGFLETRQKTYMGILNTTERELVAGPDTAGGRLFHYGDPLAQTFPVESGTQWISYVKLYFQSKDATLPVTVEIRETLNGYPTMKVLQSKTLYPASINISDDCSVATTFTFDEMVGYQAGEYCIVIHCNTTTYNVWVAKMGEVSISDGTMLRAQATGGVLFTSPNNSTWEPHATWDLTFEIGTANFQNNAQVVFDNISGLQASSFIAAVTSLMPTGTDMYWAYSVDNGTNWAAFLPYIDTDLASVATQVKLRCDVTGTGATFQILDSGAGIIALLNAESGNYIGTNAEFDDTCDEVILVADIATDGVNGSGTRSVTPYYSIDDGELWVEVKPEAGFVPVNVGDGTYKEYTFKTPGEITISAATNANPIVCTSAGHKHTENTVLTFTGATGNTNVNGIRRIVNVTDDTFELVDADTGANITGNGTFGGTCTADITPFDQCRIRMYLETGSRVVTPKVRKIRGICS
jgi:hypothetical protein